MERRGGPEQHDAQVPFGEGLDWRVGARGDRVFDPPRVASSSSSIACRRIETPAEKKKDAVSFETPVAWGFPAGVCCPQSATCLKTAVDAVVYPMRLRLWRY